MNISKLVLEDDGTEVDSMYFETLPEYCLVMILSDGQVWSQPSSSSSSGQTGDHSNGKCRNYVYRRARVPPAEISMELVTFIEKETCDQRQNQMWKDLHIGHITSSMFGDILRCHYSQEYLVKQILEGSSLDRYPQLPKAMQWGVDMEDRARQEYVTCISLGQIL